MYSPAVQRVRSPLVLVSAVLFTLAACAGKQTGDEGDASEYQPSEVVENMPAQAEPSAPDDEPTAAPQNPPPSGGPLDACTATTWTDPQAPKLEASCAQYWDESGDEPVLRYVCSCDLAECPIYVRIDNGENTPPGAALNDCVVDGVASGCRDSLEAVCGMTEGEHGFCQHEYYGLTPTRPDQDPPDSATVVCFEQSDGTYSCACPAESELVPTTETDCNRALLSACQAPCESTAGNCEPSANGYDCVCAAGFERTAETGLCEYALFHACEPACSNEEGGCYWDPSGGSQITCLCNDDSEPQSMERDPNVQGDECRTPLVETCGGSAEGPNAWP
jgi:hypothetical protein